MDTTITKAYSGGNVDDQGGGDLPYFIGKQYGSGWLRTLGRFAFPILKKVARVVGRSAQDAIVHERPILESLRNNALNEVTSTLANPSSLLPSSSSINKPKKQNVGIKRKARVNSSSSEPSFFNKKRRRRQK